MKYSPELLKAADHCQHRSFITNKYTGKRIAVDCGQCDYCIHKRAQKASMRVKTAGSFLVSICRGVSFLAGFTFYTDSGHCRTGVFDWNLLLHADVRFLH